MPRLEVKERVLKVLNNVDSASLCQLARVIDGSYSLIRDAVVELWAAGKLTRQERFISAPRKPGGQVRYVYRLADL